MHLADGQIVVAVDGLEAVEEQGGDEGSAELAFLACDVAAEEAEGFVVLVEGPLVAEGADAVFFAGGCAGAREV